MKLQEIEKRFYQDHYKKMFKYSGIMDFTQDGNRFSIVLSDGTSYLLTGCEPGNTIQVKEGLNNLIEHCKQIVEEMPDVPDVKDISLSTEENISADTAKEMVFKSCPPLKRISNILCIEQIKKKIYLRIGTKKVRFRQGQGINSYYIFFEYLSASLMREMEQNLPEKLPSGTQLENIQTDKSSNIILKIKAETNTCEIQLKINPYSLKEWILEEAISEWTVTNVLLQKELKQKIRQKADKTSKKYNGKLGVEAEFLSQKALESWEDFTGKKVQQNMEYKYNITSLSFDYRGLKYTINMTDGSVETALKSATQKLIYFYNNRVRYRKIKTTAEKIAKKAKASCEVKLRGNKKEKDMEISFFSTEEYSWDYQMVCSLNSGLDDKTEQIVMERKNEAETAWEKQIKKTFENVYSKPYYGSLLAMDCIHLVQKYENFITLPTIVSLLRGTKIKSNLPYDSENYGKYSMLSQTYIEKVMEELSTPKDGILGKELVKGTYNDYYIYKPKDKLKIKMLLEAEPSRYKKGKFLTSYSCLDWIKVMDNLNPETMSGKDWEGFLGILNEPEVICADVRVKEIFQASPPAVKECLKCLYKAEEETYKKKIIKYLIE